MRITTNISAAFLCLFITTGAWAQSTAQKDTSIMITSRKKMSYPQAQEIIKKYNLNAVMTLVFKIKKDVVPDYIRAVNGSGLLAEKVKPEDSFIMADTTAAQNEIEKFLKTQDDLDPDYYCYLIKAKVSPERRLELINAIDKQHEVTDAYIFPQ